MIHVQKYESKISFKCDSYYCFSNIYAHLKFLFLIRVILRTSSVLAENKMKMIKRELLPLPIIGKEEWARKKDAITLVEFIFI